MSGDERQKKRKKNWSHDQLTTTTYTDMVNSLLYCFNSFFTPLTHNMHVWHFAQFFRLFGFRGNLSSNFTVALSVCNYCGYSFQSFIRRNCHSSLFRNSNSFFQFFFCFVIFRHFPSGVHGTNLPDRNSQ